MVRQDFGGQFPDLALCRTGEPLVRRVADRHDDGVREQTAGTVRRVDEDAVVPDGFDGRVHVSGHLVEPEEFTQHGGVRHVDTARADEVRGHLDDDRVLALQREVVRDLAAGQAAADDDDIVADFRFAVEVVRRGDGFLGTGHRQRLRRGADGHDDEVGIQRVEVRDLRVHMDRRGALFKFAREPLQKVAVLFLEGRCGSRVEDTAEAVGLLVEVDLVSAGSSLDRHFHTADAAADDGELLRFLRGTLLVDGLVVGPGVQHALAHLVTQDIDVRALAVHAVERQAGAVAGDARTDVLKTVFLEFGDVFRVAQKLTAEAHGVDLSGGDGRGGHVGLHASRADDGLRRELLDVLDIREVQVERRVHRRVCPEPGVIGAVVAVEEIIAGLFQDLDGFLGLFHRPADLGELLTGHGAGVEALGHGADGITQRDGVVVAADFLDLFDDLTGEPQTVLQRTAVRVIPVVRVGHGELVEEVALVDGVDLDAVDPDLLAAQGRLTERIHELVDHVLRELIHLDVRRPDVRQPLVRRAPPPLGGDDLVGEVADGFVLDERLQQRRQDHGTSRARAQLEEHLRAALMDLIHDFLCRSEDFGVLVHPPFPDDADHRDESRDEQTDVVVHTVLVELFDALREAGLGLPLDHVRAFHRQHDHTVLDLDIAYLPGGKQRFVFRIHMQSLPLSNIHKCITNSHYTHSDTKVGIFLIRKSLRDANKETAGLSSTVFRKGL